LCLRLKRVERGPQGVGRRRGTGFVLEAVDHPGPEVGRVQGVRARGESALGHSGEVLTLGGAEERANGGDFEQSGDLPGAARFGRGVHMFLWLESRG
jgi:hypothetical protein